ncbi:GNAT family N-acetyltransferase [Desulfosporosinus sp. FKA]|uniref:GNAT family N-acetyltransferase n=1 Tax=Desulfosporosinus sp. FKA TaxID=1969834 RepID=UPI000B4A30BF|nr:GNAT family N-acetyltransferase [Desulfosporosinus sp. FKA]
MKVVADSLDVFNAINLVKMNSKRTRTNFTVNLNKLALWISKKELTLIEYEGAMLLFRKNADFYYMYFFVNEDTDFSFLENINFVRRNVVVVDLLGKSPDLDDLGKEFAAEGFDEHLHLQRMFKINSSLNSNLYADRPMMNNIKVATEIDGQTISEILNNNFDKYGEQIPNLNEIYQEIDNGNILLYKSNYKILGLLYFNNIGQTSILRYWIVIDKYQNEGIGGKLIKFYFQMCQNIRRFIVWVVSDNINAINKYEHYGYKLDGLYDKVLIQRGVT